MSIEDTPNKTLSFDFLFKDGTVRTNVNATGVDKESEVMTLSIVGFYQVYTELGIDTDDALEILNLGIRDLDSDSDNVTQKEEEE